MHTTIAIDNDLNPFITLSKNVLTTLGWDIGTRVFIDVDYHGNLVIRSSEPFSPSNTYATKETYGT